MRKETKRKSNNCGASGQVMLLAVLTLGGLLLSSAAFSGILMIYQVRGANDVVNSAKAIFAADAGIELVTYCYFLGCNDPGTIDVTENASNPPKISFDDSQISVDVSPNQTPVTLVITARGYSAGGKILRILEATFQ